VSRNNSRWSSNLIWLAVLALVVGLIVMGVISLPR
jgi:uncharacterized membrane protein